MTGKLNLWAGGLLLLCAGAAQAELAIVGHPSLNIAGVSKAEVRDIYLDRENEFSDGTRAEPVTQPARSPAREEFVKKVLGMDERSLKSFWAKRMFTGRARPPRELSGDEQVREWVASHPHALGYIDGDAVDSSVKVLLIIP
jgi:ABC-type phosphate transport system substrate-binding protein